MYAFISYQTKDKIIAGRIKDILDGIEIPSFLAHEDINMSEEWRVKILEEIGKTDLFISLWSKSYYESMWCIQESGIASFREGMTIIPLSIDGSVPQGFAGNIQSSKIDPENISISDILPGLVKADFRFGIDLIFNIITNSKSYRSAEANFRMLNPYIPQLSEEQGKRVLEIAIGNNQVHHAGSCATEYLPPLMERYGRYLDPENHQFLSEILARYSN